MANTACFPDFVRFVAEAGADAIRATAPAFAEWQLSAPLELTGDDPVVLATEVLSKLNYPNHFFYELPADAKIRVATVAGIGTPEEWAATQPDDLDDPVDRWEGAVSTFLSREIPAPPPPLRPATEHHVHAAHWPDLTNPGAYAKADAVAVSTALAAALGPEWTPAEGDGIRVRHAVTGLVFTAVPGGRYAMGFAETDAAAVTAAGLQPDALLPWAGPAHEVTVSPFLCAERPLIASDAATLGIVGDAGNPPGLLRLTGAQTADLTDRLDLRLLCEAEWEWIARSGSPNGFLGEQDSPVAWAEHASASPLAVQRSAFGVLGLGWGEWVDDSWHPDFTGAPAESVPWEPRVRPQTVRGAALMSWPWQSDGEAITAHITLREPASEKSIHCVRLALDLPAAAVG